MKIHTAEEEKRRLDNITYAEQHVNKCTRRVRIHDYIPGQISYNLGGYPAKFAIMPTEYDVELIQKLAEKGVGLIQVHEEWNDPLRIMGADKFSSHDPEGLIQFIELCHSFGIKVLPYISSSYFDARDPDCREEFFPDEEPWLCNIHYQYRRGSVESPQWRSYLLDKVHKMLEAYPFDGIYNDMGYHGPPDFHKKVMESNGLLVDEPLPYDPYAEDFLAQLYGMTKEKGGIMKLHIGRNKRPATTEKLYDYLWIGESVTNTQSMLESVSYDPYVIPCPDYKRIDDNNYESLYAQMLPFMQFPLGLDGRPLTADKANVPGIEYTPSRLTDFYKQVGEYHNAHPNGPYVYSEWSSIPDNVKNRERWDYYLKLYQPMVEENNICHLNVTESTLIKGKLPEHVYMSLFTGTEQYICISNLGSKEAVIGLDGVWQDCETGELLKELKLTVQRVRFLKRMSMDNCCDIM